MSAYERQLIAKYHHAELLSEAHQAHLAKIARDAKPHTERVTMTSLTGPLQSILTSARAWVTLADRGGRQGRHHPAVPQRAGRPALDASALGHSSPQGRRSNRHGHRGTHLPAGARSGLGRHRRAARRGVDGDAQPPLQRRDPRPRGRAGRADRYLRRQRSRRRQRHDRRGPDHRRRRRGPRLQPALPDAPGRRADAHPSRRRRPARGGPHGRPRSASAASWLHPTRPPARPSRRPQRPRPRSSIAASTRTSAPATSSSRRPPRPPRSSTGV